MFTRLGAFDADREDAVLEGHVHVLAGHAGDGRAEDEGVIRLEDVDRQRKRRRSRLSLLGSAVPAPFERQGRWLRQERPWGNWSRKLELPKDVQPDKISANVEHGMLTVTVPKAAAAQPVRIPIGAKGSRTPLESS